MGIFNIFNRDKEEEYKGVKLVSDVDTSLQKKMIDSGRSGEIQSLRPVKETSFIKEFGNAAADLGKSYINEAVKPALKLVNDKAILPATEWLNKVDDVAEGKVQRDDGQPILVEDMPMAQQVAGSVFHVSKNIGRGVLGTTESAMRGFQWLGVDSAKPLADKLTDWQKSVAPENPGFADNLASGLGSAITFFVPGIGAMKGAQAIGMFSPRLAMLFGNSAMTAFEALTEAGDSYQSALDEGKNEKLANDTATKVFWANAVLIGLTNKLAYFNEVKGLKKLLISSPMEGLQEFGQQVIQNVTSGRPWDQGAWEAGAIGTIIGGILGGHEIGMEAIKEPSVSSAGKDKQPAQVAVPEAFYQVETGNETKYFETKEQADGYANSLPAGTFIVNEKGSQDAIDILKSNNYSYFPFEGGKSATQIKIDSAILEIQNNSGLNAKQSAEAFALIKNMVESEKTSKDYPEIFNTAVDMAKLENGELPDIVQQAVKQAQKEVEVQAADMQPEAIYHQTDQDAETIKDTGFKMGKNSAFGEAAFFGEKANKLYGENQVAAKPADYNLKTFKTVAEQQKYIAAQKAKNLSEAIRKEGKYDGFIIPNKEIGNVYGITNKEKLDQKLKQQQFVSTREARALSKNFKFIEDLGLPMIVREKILTPAGQEAFGKYFKGVISFVENPHKTTIPHEAVHAFLDLMLTKKQKQAVIDEVKRRYAGKKFTDIQAEEQLAEDFVKYYQKKFDNPATAKAPSNKLKQFFDWFIEQLKKLTGKGDIIENLYKDILNKRPGIIQKQMIRQRIKRGLSYIDDLQKEYFQNPDALTTKFLENVDVKNRETSSYQFLKNLLKSKSLPLKASERDLIDDILDTQFKDEKKINMADFRSAVRGELMPLQVIMSDTYANYGMDNIGFDYTSSINPPETHIYSSPFNHGYTGHFSGDFKLDIARSDLDIKQIPGQEKFAVIRKGIELNEDNIAENVYHVANSEEEADKWIKSKISYGKTVDDDPVSDVGRKGLFGHVRVWDTEDSKKENGIGDIRYVAEIQSDAFQNMERVEKANPDKYFDYITKEEAAKKLENGEEFYAIDSGGGERQITSQEAFESAAKYDERFGVEKSEPVLSKEEKQFNQYKNVWHERLIREEIRRAAMDGKTKLRFPMPYTVAKIEGYLSEDGQIPEGTAVGDTFEYMGDEYILLTNSYDENGKAVPAKDVRGTWDFDTVRQDEVNNEIDVAQDAANESKTFSEFADNYYTGDLSEELIDKIKAEYESKGLLINETIEEIAEEAVDSRFRHAEGFVDYYNDNVEKDYAFATEDGRLIFLNDNKNIETLGFGTTEGDKENFNYEEDLDGQEQRTVARFYDKQVNRYLAKLRKQNLREVTDDNGYDWLETDILPEDKAAVEAFQTKPAEDPAFRSGKEVLNYVDEIEERKGTPEEMDEIIDRMILSQNFKLTSLKIDQLLEEDLDVESYVKSGVNRYEEGEGSDPTLPIVVGFWDNGSWGVIDGYNRVLTAVQNGQKYIEAFVSTKKGQINRDDYDIMVNFVDYVRLNQPENVDLEVNARYLAEGMNINPDMTNRKLANRFSKILDDQPRYQIKDDAKRFELEVRRGEFMDRLSREEYEREMEIIAARETDLSFPDSEKEAGYQNFKDLVRYRKWILDPQTDEATLKFRVRDKNLDNYLFEGAKDMTNDDLLMMFKDRYAQEQEIKAIASQKTPTEIAAFEKRKAEYIVKKETVGKKPTIKNAINVAIGMEKPAKITMKETTLLVKKIRDIARGVKMGRADMRDTMIEAFRTKQEDIASIKKAIIAYADDLPANEKGRLLPMIAKAQSQRDLAKAFMRINAAVERSDKIEQLQELKETAAEVRTAMKTGKGIIIDYQRKIMDVLSDYNFSRPTDKTFKKLIALRDYLKNNEDAIVPPHLIKELDRLSKVNVKDLDANTIRNINELLNRLVALGHLKLQLKNNYDERVRQASVAKLVLSTNSNDPKGDPKDDGYNRKEAKKRMYLNTLHSFRVTDQIDGFLDYKGQNTRLQRLISSKVNNAELTANSVLRSVFDEIRTIQNNWTEKEQAIMEFHLLIQQGAHTQANELATIQGWKEAPELTPEMETAMDLMRAAFTKNEDYLAAVYEEINNKPFEKVQNYFPLKYEQRRGEIPEPTIGQKVIRSAQTEQGFTFKRLPNVKRTPRTDVFAQFEEAIREQQYYMNVQPTLLEVRSLINDDAYKAKAGRIFTNWWRDYIDGMSNRGQLSGVRSNAWLRHKRIQLSRAILGYKLSTILLQPMAIFDAVAYVQLRYGQTAAARLLLHFAGTWINPFYARRVIRMSPSLELRKGTAGELAVEEVIGTSKRQKLSGAYNRAAFMPIQYTDMKTAASVDQAIYKILRGQKISEAEARTEADMIMNIVSGSSEVADRPMVLMSGEGMRAIFTFQTFMLNRWGLIAHDIVRSGLVRGSLGRKAKSIYALFILALAGGIEDELRKKIFELVSGKEIKDKLSFWANGFLAIPEAIPIIGQFIRGYFQYGQSFSIPMTRVIETFRLGTQEILSGDPEKQKRGLLRVGEAIATWNGIAGSAQIGDFTERLMLNNKTNTKTQYDIDLPAIPDVQVPDIKLPALPELPDL